MAETVHSEQQEGGTRRDFLYLATGAVGAIGVGAVAWPLIDTLNPSADVLALASTEVDLSPIEVGQRVTVTWRGKPTFIDHRPEDAIEAARAVSLDDLIDPQADEERVTKPEWLILVGVCTHLGCVPLGDGAGEFGGWFCPCHGSHYDTSGRIRKGPAPENLPIPQASFVSDTVIKLG